MCIHQSMLAQQPSHPDTMDNRIVKTGGTDLIGRIFKDDERELTIRTSDGRLIIVPQYIVKEIQPVSKDEISEKVEFIGEDHKPGLGLFIPGVRWHQSEGKAFQFGFTGISFDG